MSAKFFGTLPKLFDGTKRRPVVAVGADLQSEEDQFMDAVIVRDLQENKRERTDTLLRIFFCSRYSTRVQTCTLRSIEGFACK